MDWLGWLLHLAVFVLIVAGLQKVIFWPDQHQKLTAERRKLTAGFWKSSARLQSIKNPEPVIELPGHEKGTGLGTAATARKSAHAVAQPEPDGYSKIFTMGSGLIPNPMLRPAIGLDQAERWYPELQLNGDGTHEKVYHAI